VNAAKERFGKPDLKRVFDGATKVIVAKGKKVVELDLKGDPAAWKALPDLVLGPTGNLRAPAIRTGSTWLVGFHEDAFAKRFE
jgi:hypothetical protein